MQPGAGDSSSDTDAVLAILSRPEDDDLTDIVELVAKICDAAAAGITINKDDEYHVPITYGIEPFVSPSTDTFCQHAMSTQGVFAVEDAQADPRFADIGWVDGTIARARFYASAPLYSPHGYMVGRLCVIDPAVKSLTALQQRSLETLATNVTRLIELRMLRTSRLRLTTPDSAQTKATVISQLAAELSHDLRVPLSSVIASAEMLEDELEERSSPVIDALLAQTVRSAERMERMIEQSLEYGVAGDQPVLTDVDLAHVAHQLVLNPTTLLDAAGVKVEIADLPVVRADPGRHVLRAPEPAHQLHQVRPTGRPGRGAHLRDSGCPTPGGSLSATTASASPRIGEWTSSPCSPASRPTSRGTASDSPRSRGSSRPMVAARVPSRVPPAEPRSGSRSPMTPPSGSEPQYRAKRAVRLPPAQQPRPLEGTHRRGQRLSRPDVGTGT